ncbi:hypothetical protein NE235_10745 [Actinoallomurus spadix]|uniref:Uncharacterized protein n=1 Tax=Actinoallomurus spadix TaxID=79912 RepID=A0ABP3GPE3_9ACTN|nr:hypothetical protein [Actinoallomurus spadix]MCO5986580.1 hypothetical protein [Actinoallomurus spadix]
MTRQNTRRDERHEQRWKAEIERRLQKLETSPRAGHTSVSHGKFLIQDGSGGAHLLRAGYLGDDDAGEVRGMSMHRPSGEFVFSTWSGQGDDSGGFWGLYDKATNAVVSDDVVSGQGLATPYIGAPNWAPGDRSKWPSVDVTGTAYITQWRGAWWKQHPRLHVVVWTWSDPGTSGDVQVTCNGVSATKPVSSGDNEIQDLYLTVPGNHLTWQQVTVDLRRTSGSGFCGCWPMGAYGVQS